MEIIKQKWWNFSTSSSLRRTQITHYDRQIISDKESKMININFINKILLFKRNVKERHSLQRIDEKYSKLTVTALKKTC